MNTLGVVLVALTAVLYGKIEAVVYDRGFQPMDNNKLLSWFAPSYHIPLALLWLTICCLGGVTCGFFTYCMIEDVSYFAFSRTDTLDARDWINWKLGGFCLGSLWIPYTYLVSNTLTLLLYAFV